MRRVRFNRFLKAAVIAASLLSLPFSAQALDLQDYLLEVFINQSKSYQLLHCFLDEEQHLWVAKDDLLQWHLKLPDNPPLDYLDKTYYRLDWIKDIRYQLDPATLILYLTIPPKLLPPTHIGLIDDGGRVPKIRPTKPGTVFNYDASIQRVSQIPQTSLATLGELVYFNRYGVGSADFLFNTANQGNELIRLETTWTIDRPEKLDSIRIGDSMTNTVVWGGSVYFGGFQWGTNFATQPYLVTFPLPGYQGEAIVPTTMSVFVNDNLRLKQEIESGPFAVYDLPVVTGEGSVKIVTQNILGRQEEFEIPYYATERLLKPGLPDFSVEVGVARNNLGLNSFDYGRFLLVGTQRKGINKIWTVGWHGELLAEQQTIGFTNDYLWKDFVITSLGGAVSHSTLGMGDLFLVGFQRKTDTLSYGSQAIYASPNFTQLGMVPEQPAPMLRLQVYSTYATAKFGTWSLSYTGITDRNQTEFTENGTLSFLPTAKILTMNYSHNLWGGFYVMLTSIMNLNQSQNNIYSIALIRGLSDSRSVTATAQFQAGDNQEIVTLNKNLPWGDGYGYRFSGSHGTPNQGQGSFIYQNDYGTYTAQVAQTGDYTNYLGEVSGSFIHFGHHNGFSRMNYDSFSLVEVPGIENVCVYSRNVCVGRTNEEGLLLVPNLLAYQNNKIGIEPKDLPLNTQVDLVELYLIPYYRSGLLAEFNVIKTYQIVVKLVNENYQPLAVGTKIRLSNQDVSAFVGDDGSAYIPSRRSGIVTGYAYPQGGECVFQVRVPEESVMADMGVVYCFNQ